MHYDIEVDLAAENTSHAQVVDLVGTGKDVLDVGCSTGYLAKVLTERGCRVSGVELDPEAAEAARAHCEAVLVADLDRDDLAALAFEHPFDVIVFADILEHLRDPVRTLRASASLLRPGGYVVVSIPNVGHGSVRLALAAGRFDYRDAGLLDRTHLRFFTRETLADLLSTAGFSLQELRRTTAGVLETEIPVDPSAVPAGLLAEVEQDPEARTYQFVLTAVPLDAGSGGAAAALARKDREIDALRSQFAEVLRALGPGPSAPAVTVLVASPRGMWRIRSEVVAAELAGRLDGFRVEVLESADLDRLRSGTARPVAVVPVGAVDGPLAAALDHLAGGATVVLPEPGGGGWPGPDVAMLTPSLYDGALVEQRVRFLRLVGVLPSAGELL
ncbi:MAG TPA: class I SAM-dependent methyltransferase, partial [Acidimicrobiales bacterium]|nr:class I SAM-dependent methyltransferase [Acidimicrobiales bacterium]